MNSLALWCKAKHAWRVAKLGTTSSEDTLTRIHNVGLSIIWWSFSRGPRILAHRFPPLPAPTILFSIRPLVVTPSKEQGLPSRWIRKFRGHRRLFSRYRSLKSRTHPDPSILASIYPHAPTVSLAIGPWQTFYMISLVVVVIPFDRKDNLGVGHSSTKVPEVCLATTNCERSWLERATTSNQLSQCLFPWIRCLFCVYL